MESSVHGRTMAVFREEALAGHEKTYSRSRGQWPEPLWLFLVPVSLSCSVLASFSSPTSRTPEDFLGGLVGFELNPSAGDLKCQWSKESMVCLSRTLKAPDVDSTGLQRAAPLSVTFHPLCWPYDSELTGRRLHLFSL